MRNSTGIPARTESCVNRHVSEPARRKPLITSIPANTAKTKSIPARTMIMSMLLYQFIHVKEHSCPNGGNVHAPCPNDDDSVRHESETGFSYNFLVSESPAVSDSVFVAIAFLADTEPPLSPLSRLAIALNPKP